MRKLVAALVLVVVYARPAAAHSINVFAIAEGKTLQGEVYARGGEPIRQAKVSIFSPAGETLGETTTDDEGKFTFEARFRTDHRLVVDTGDGHEAEYTVPAEELPESLPGRDGEPAVQPEPSSPPQRPIDASPATAESSGDVSMHEELAALQAQVAQLRRELAAHQQKLRLTDVAGAIGYILGLMGLSFYFLGVRKRNERRGARGEG